LFLPLAGRNNERNRQFFRQDPIRFKILRGTVDLARFFVVLYPAEEYAFVRHARLGEYREDILPNDEPPTYLDENLSVVCEWPPILGLSGGLF
jgi:hypothetical protein